MQTTIKKKLIYKFLPWLVPALLLILWKLGTNNQMESTIFPTPDEVFKRAVDMTKSGQLLEYTLVSARRALIGFAIGGLIGFSLGLLNGLSNLADVVLNTTIQMLRTIPVLALISLMIIWFGIGEEVKIIMVAFGVFFPIYINTYHGIKNIDKSLLEMADVYGVKGYALFRDLILPGALSSILVGVRLSLGTMWLILIAAETIAADAGIGYMSMTARELMQMDKVVLSIIIYALLGKLSDVIASGLEKRLLRWKNV